MYGHIQQCKLAAVTNVKLGQKKYMNGNIKSIHSLNARYIDQRTRLIELFFQSKEPPPTILFLHETDSLTGLRQSNKDVTTRMNISKQ